MYVIAFSKKVQLDLKKSIVSKMKRHDKVNSFRFLKAGLHGSQFFSFNLVISFNLYLTVNVGG